MKCERCGACTPKEIVFKLGKELIPMHLCLDCTEPIYKTASHQAAVFDFLVDAGLSGRAAGNLMKARFRNYAS